MKSGNDKTPPNGRSRARTAQPPTRGRKGQGKGRKHTESGQGGQLWNPPEWDPLDLRHWTPPNWVVPEFNPPEWGPVVDPGKNTPGQSENNDTYNDKTTINHGK